MCGVKDRRAEVVAPRKRRVSRNARAVLPGGLEPVAPRKRRVSRNLISAVVSLRLLCRASQEACE